MQETNHYQLSQWDAADRIRMADFNRDNAAVDAALGEVTAGLAAERAARETLAGRVGTQVIRTVETTAAANAVNVSLSGVNWDSWSTIHMILTPKLSSGSVMTVYANDTSMVIGSTSGLAQIILFPTFNRQLPAGSLFFSGSDMRAKGLDTTYSGFSKLVLLASQNGQVLTGTKLSIWGMK